MKHHLPYLTFCALLEVHSYPKHMQTETTKACALLFSCMGLIYS